MRRQPNERAAIRDDDFLGGHAIQLGFPHTGKTGRQGAFERLNLEPLNLERARAAARAPSRE